MKAWVWTGGTGGIAARSEVLEGSGALVRIDPLGIELPFPDIYARMRLSDA